MQPAQKTAQDWHSNMWCCCCPPVAVRVLPAAAPATVSSASCSKVGALTCPSAYAATVPVSGALITISGAFSETAARHTTVSLHVDGADTPGTACTVADPATDVKAGSITCTAPARDVAQDTELILRVSVAGQATAYSAGATPVTLKYSECVAGQGSTQQGKAGLPASLQLISSVLPLTPLMLSLCPYACLSGIPVIASITSSFTPATFVPLTLASPITVSGTYLVAGAQVVAALSDGTTATSSAGSLCTMDATTDVTTRLLCTTPVIADAQYAGALGVSVQLGLAASAPHTFQFIGEEIWS